MKEQLVRREVIQLVFVLLMEVGSAVVILHQLCVRFLLGLVLVLFLSVSVHAEWY